jgi:hypothetical protein
VGLPNEQAEDESAEEKEPPVIRVLCEDELLTFQNYGNADNYYVIFQGLPKYVKMVKHK